jgi:hypothetical protein
MVQPQSTYINFEQFHRAIIEKRICSKIECLKIKNRCKYRAPRGPHKVLQTTIDTYDTYLSYNTCYRHFTPAPVWFITEFYSVYSHLSICVR